MKLLLCLLFPVIGYSQITLEKVSILNDKVEIMAPKELTEMSGELWSLKYRNKPRPSLVLSDSTGEINLIADMTDQPATESQMTAFKDFQLKQIIAKRPDATILSNGIKMINGKRVGYFKFISKAVDQNIFNYFFFVIVQGKILLFTFNCTEKLQAQWEKSADEIVASIKVK
ncbi:MAG: hypothetical protein ABI480_14550 [Chitinophagaceae bacterium]